MNNPDRLVDADSIKDGSDAPDNDTWIVRLEHRKIECRFYFIDKAGNVNARLSSAMLMPKDVAKQYAKAITEQHPKYKARAMLYSTMQRRRDAGGK